MLTKKAKMSFRESRQYNEWYKSSAVIVPISVGQKYHEGERFKATIDLINRKKLKLCNILICDLLQRHTLMARFGLTAERAEALSRELGDEWLNRNSINISRLEMECKVSRWHEYLNTQKFRDNLVLVEKFYLGNFEFRKPFDDAADEFIKRNSEIRDNTNYRDAHFHCVQYLKEECAVTVELAKSPCKFLLYPNNMLLPMELTLKYFDCYDKISWLTLRYGKRVETTEFEEA